MGVPPETMSGVGATWSAVRRGVTWAGLAGTAVAGVSAAGSLGAATYFARRVLTPDPRRPDDTQILGVRDGEVVLGLTENTAMPGRYGLWLDGGEGHARLGDVLEVDRAAGRVRRVVEAVDRGRLTIGFGRWNQYYFGLPPQESLGLATCEVDIRSDVGDLPAWHVPAGAEAGADPGGDRGTATSRRWAVLVHGRGARREECLRAVTSFHRAGYDCLVPMYRNDIGAPPSPDGRYNLGLSEWRDVEAAVLHAVDQGAEEVALAGWSMGGAIVLQMLARSWLAERVSRIVLDAPVIDWADVLRHQAALNGVPGPVGALSRALIGHRNARRLVGVHEPIDVAETDWVARAEELRHPVLLIHSEDDEFVPAGPSAALAAKRPDLVRYEPWRVARHTKEWNVDPERWERVVGEFLSR